MEQFETYIIIASSVFVIAFQQWQVYLLEKRLKIQDELIEGQQKNNNSISIFTCNLLIQDAIKREDYEYAKKIHDLLQQHTNETNNTPNS